jgi:hypothetical protein
MVSGDSGLAIISLQTKYTQYFTIDDTLSGDGIPSKQNPGDFKIHSRH